MVRVIIHISRGDVIFMNFISHLQLFLGSLLAYLWMIPPSIMVIALGRDGVRFLAFRIGLLYLMNLCVNEMVHIRVFTEILTDENRDAGVTLFMASACVVGVAYLFI